MVSWKLPKIENLWNSAKWSLFSYMIYLYNVIVLYFHGNILVIHTPCTCTINHCLYLHNTGHTRFVSMTNLILLFQTESQKASLQHRLVISMLYNITWYCTCVTGHALRLCNILATTMHFNWNQYIWTVSFRVPYGRKLSREKTFANW